MHSLHPLDIAVIIAYFLAMIGIGLWSMRRTKSREDYLVAGRRLGFPVFFGCIAALAVGGAVTVGGTGKGYEDGVAGILVGGSLGMGLIALGMLISSKLNRLRALSINEVVERNYGPAARVFGAVLTIVYTIALTVVQVVSMGAIAAGLFKIPETAAMAISGLVVVFYTFLGGMWSVTMTDIVQFVIKTLGVVILVPIFVLASPRIGGLSGFLDKVPETHWDLGAYGWTGTLYWILLYVPGLVIGQDIWQRVFTARNERIARTGTILAGVYSILYALCAVLLGMAVLAAGIEVDNPALAFEAGVSAFLPAGVAGLLLAAALAACMSVASGTILACSTVVYNDLYLRFVRGQKSSESASHTGEAKADGQVATSRDVWINRAIALSIGLLTVLLAVVISDIFKALDLAYGFLSGCVFIPVFFSFVLRRISPRAGLVSLALSALTVAGTMVYGETGGGADFAIGGNWPITFGIIVGLVSYLSVTALDHNRIVPNIEIDDEAHAPA
ncbi:sodium:solute symporter family transporter [Actinomyces bowdenii]|uniref:Sodium:solute symporter n=1 Tax=Actinomyces bowdenii TaxID=131109 RepID=A0A3P1V8B2_9ACTO|nr:sodium:solute symporter [Actinomyces bowdenii]RRD29740.1 sodium:solute symporter [Actinomyces bowdenii]